MLVVTHLPSVSGLHMASVSRATSARTLLSMPSVCVCVWLLSVTASFQSSVWRLRALRSVKTEDQRETPPLSQEEGMKEEGGGLDPVLRQPPSPAKVENVLAKIQQWQSDSDSLSLVSIFLCIFFLLSEERRKQSPCCYLSIVVSQCFDLLLFVSCHVFLVVDFHLTGAVVFPGSQVYQQIPSILGFYMIRVYLKYTGKSLNTLFVIFKT